jgi:hypothetical protein
MSDTVLAVVPRAALSAVLTAFHRNGYGHVTRVLDPERAPVPDQLRRAGISGCRLASLTPNACVLLHVYVPERTTPAASLAVAHGALDCELVHAGGIPVTTAASLLSAAGDRRERRAGRRTVSRDTRVMLPGLDHTVAETAD